jgi:fluoride exporter
VNLTTCLVIMLGGALGTLARYALWVLAAPISGDLPLGTILINVSGSFAIGLFATLTLDQGRFPVSENIRMFVMVGLCGGFTTFSAFSLQTFELLRAGLMARALVNIAASVILCVAAVALGHLAAAQLNGASTFAAQVRTEEDV